MRYLITGSSGQLAREFIARFERAGIDFAAPGEGELDITDASAVEAAVHAVRPQVVLNCAAYNNVDKAESDFDLACRVNAVAVGHLARACQSTGAVLVHYSSDYVFDGAKQGLYTEEDAPNPINRYGESKRLGELELLDDDRQSPVDPVAEPADSPRHSRSGVSVACDRSPTPGPAPAGSGRQAGPLESCGRPQALQRSPDGDRSYLLFRLSWVYGPGQQNFLCKLLEWSATKPVLHVVWDQISVPTYTADVVEFSLAALEHELRGLYHLTNTGYASRYEVARLYLRLAGRDTLVLPADGSRFPSPARRPFFSAMANARLAAALGREIPDWEDALARYVARPE